MQGLELDSDGPIGGKNFETHDLVIVAEQNHESAKQKYSERENKNWGLSFSSIDISLCFGIYVLSAAILILVNWFWRNWVTIFFQFRYYYSA